MVELASTIWADGPASMPHKPRKSEIRKWGSWLEGLVSAFTSNGGLIYSSLADLNADLSKPANSMAWVMGDPIAENNGVYGKLGAQGTGSWMRRSDLPFPVIVAEDSGEGTPNAIQATSALPVSGSSLVSLAIYENNTASPVTVSFNGGPPLTMKSNSGNDVGPGGLPAIVLGRVNGSTFRLLSDVVSTSVIAAAEAYSEETKEARNEALAAAAGVNLPPSAPNRMLVDNPAGTARESKTFDEVNELLGLTFIKDLGGKSVDLRKFRTTYVDPSNWSSVLQAAADSAERKIDVPGDAAITFADQFTISAAGQKWVGSGYDWASYMQRTTNVSEPAIVVTGERCGFANIGLRGVDYQALNNPLNVGIRVARPAGSRADLDFSFINGYISEFYYLVEGFGRGVTIQDNLLSRARYAVNVNWPTDGSYSKDNFVGDSDTNGFRRWNINRNEFHSIGVGLVRNRDSSNAGNAMLNIEGNRSNFGRCLFSGFLGGGSIISGNTIQNANTAMMELDGGRDYVVRGNQMVADRTPAGSPGPFTPPDSFIKMTGSHNGFLIDGFFGAYCREHGIDIRNGDVNGILRNIDLRDVGIRDAATYCGILSIATGSGTQLMVDGVTLRQTINSAQNILRLNTSGSVAQHRGIVSRGLATTATGGPGTFTAV